MTEEGHLVFLVDDDPVALSRMQQLVRGAGHRSITATNVKQALAMLEEHDPCALVFDHELPIEEGAEPLRASGRRLTEAARKQDARLRPGTFFAVRQIMVVTGVSTHPDFVTDMHALGATHFHAKPLGPESGEMMMGKLDVCFQRAGRATHADCAAWALPRAGVVRGPRIRVDGTRERARMVIHVDGARETMQEAAMLSLLRAIVAHERAPGVWSPRTSLSIGGSRNATSRIQDPFRSHVADDFRVLESDWDNNYRLNASVVIEEIDWAVLVQHPNAQIRKLAKEQIERIERRGKKTTLSPS